MCCIAACYDGRLDPDTLTRMHIVNNDGLGIAWIHKNKVRWKKGLSLTKMKVYTAKIPLPYVVHARLATMGDTNGGLTHPFPIEYNPRTKLTGTAKSVLFHNGHLNDIDGYMVAAGAQFTLDKAWSDSRAIAHLVAMRGAKFLEHIHGKYAILNKGGIDIYGTGWTNFKASGFSLSSPPVVHSYRYHSSMYDTEDDESLKYLYRRAEGERWQKAKDKYKVLNGGKSNGVG